MRQANPIYTSETFAANDDASLIFSPPIHDYTCGLRLADDEAGKVLAQFTQMMNRMEPYFTQTSVSGAVRMGHPVGRAMSLEFPNDPTCWSLDLEFMLGADSPMAPVLLHEKAGLYLPAGKWTNILTGDDRAKVREAVWRAPTVHVVQFHTRRITRRCRYSNDATEYGLIEIVSGLIIVQSMASTMELSSGVTRIWTSRAFQSKSILCGQAICYAHYIDMAIFRLIQVKLKGSRQSGSLN